MRKLREFRIRYQNVYRDKDSVDCEKRIKAINTKEAWEKAQKFVKRLNKKPHLALESYELVGIDLVRRKRVMVTKEFFIRAKGFLSASPE